MFLLLSILLTALIWLLTKAAANTKLEIRSRVLHIRYVVMTVVYSVLCVVFFSPILNILNQFLSIPAIRNLLLAIIPPGNVTAGFYWVVTILSCALIMLGYVLVMVLLRIIWLKPLESKNNLEPKFFLEKPFNMLAGLFYELLGGHASLPPSNANVGCWIRSMRRIFGVLLLAESLLMGLYLQMDLTFLGANLFPTLVKSLYMIPVVSYIILEQMELFLAADRTTGDVLTDTEEIGMTQKGDFSGLLALYERLFGGKALISHYVGNGKGDMSQSMFSGVTTEQKDRADSPELLDALCRNVSCVTTPAPYYINSLIELINGNSLAISDTPWGEFDAYYLAYIQHQLVLKRTALVLCDSKLQVQRMTQRFTSVFEKLNIITPIWRIRNMDQMVDGQTDILICTDEEFLANPINEQYPQFYNQLKVVVSLDAYGLLCREGAFAARIFDHFADKDIQYIFYMQENNSDICAQLERLVKTTVLPCENSYSNPTTKVLFWRSDAAYKTQHTISERLYHDFGVAYTIAIIAGKCEVPAVHVLAPDWIPLDTYFHLTTQEYAVTLLEDYLKTDAINLRTVIHNNNYSVADTSALSFCVVYDELNNLLNVAKTWLSYGGTYSSMLHVISGPYMLRNYLASNVDKLHNAISGIQLIIPGNPIGLRAPATALLLQLRHGVSSQRILNFAQACGSQEQRLEQILSNILDLVLGPHHGYSVYQCFNFAECQTPHFDGKYRYSTTVTLINETLYRKVCQMTEDFVRLDGSRTQVFPAHKEDIYNHFLPGQLVSFDNRRYRVDNISHGRAQLSVEDTVEFEYFYTPVWNLTDMRRNRDLASNMPKNELISTEYFEATITRKTDAYYAHPGMLDLTSPNTNQLVELETPIVETKTVPCLQLSLECPLDNCSEKVANTLCFLLRGAMETFLPKNHKDLLIFSKIDKAAVQKGVTFVAPNGLLDDPIPSDLMTGFDVVEKIDPAILRLIPDINSDAVRSNEAHKIYLYIAQFSEVDVGLLTAIAMDLDRILQTVYKYLNWSEAQAPGASEYLRFGYETTPGIFDTAATAYCLPLYFPQIAISNAEAAGKLQLAGSNNGLHCSFCGKPVSLSYVEMDDGRIMCSDCSSHVTNSREEVKLLLGEAKETLEKHYQITLPEGIKVKFKSASAIRKQCKTSSGRVLGFYILQRREIWIERNGPRPCVLSTLLHELTHAWQHANIKMNIPLRYLEGHTSFVEVECMRLLRQGVYAEFQESALMARDDVYGEGYRLWKECLQNENDKNLFHHMEKRFPKE